MWDKSRPCLPSPHNFLIVWQWDRTLDFDKIPEWLIHAGLEAEDHAPSTYEYCCGSPRQKKKDPLLLERQRRLSNVAMGEHLQITEIVIDGEEKDNGPSAGHTKVGGLGPRVCDAGCATIFISSTRAVPVRSSSNLRNAWVLSWVEAPNSGGPYSCQRPRPTLHFP